MKVNVQVEIPDGLFCGSGEENTCKFCNGDSGRCVLFSDNIEGNFYDENGEILLKFERDRYNYKKCKSCLAL